MLKRRWSQFCGGQPIRHYLLYLFSGCKYCGYENFSGSFHVKRTFLKRIGNVWLILLQFKALFGKMYKRYYESF